MLLLRPQAMASAPVKIDAQYHAGVEHHNPMEMHASTVLWRPGDQLTIHDKSQGAQNCQQTVLQVFGRATHVGPHGAGDLTKLANQNVSYVDGVAFIVSAAARENKDVAGLKVLTRPGRTVLVLLFTDIVSLFLAFTIWYVANIQSDPIQEQQYQAIQVQMTLDDSMILVNQPTTSVR